MKITSLLDLVRKIPKFRWLIDELKQSEVSLGLSILDAAKPYVISAIYKELCMPVLVIVAQPHKSRDIQEQISAWTDVQTSLFPEPTTLPYQHVVPEKSTMMERIRVLSLLTGFVKGDQPPLVISSTPALISKVPLYNHFIAASHKIRLGMDIDPLSLIDRWQKIGYRLENIVEMPGNISHRGGILDIYPPTNELPARIEFFGNTIDSIRLYDPINQRSLKPVSEIDINPAAEMLVMSFGDRVELERMIKYIEYESCNNAKKQQFQQELDMLLEGCLPVGDEFYAQLLNRGHILDYLPEKSLVIVDEPLSVRGAVEYLDAEAGKLLEYKLKHGDLPINLPQPYFSWDELESRLNKRKYLSIDSWLNDSSNIKWQLNFKQSINYAGMLPEFLERVKQLLRQRKRVILISHQAKRLSELLEEKDIVAESVIEMKEKPLPGSLTLVQGMLNRGWVMDDFTYLYTDSEIFGFIKQRRLFKKQPVARLGSIFDITPGDFVVHLEHGIARFAGVVNMDSDGIKREYLLLHYAAGDRLYVPVD
ncbi:MAG: transcription-repair coupling factor, partial [Dehalococcoidia bacterium]